MCATQAAVQQSESDRLHKCLRDAFERETLVAYRLRGAAPGGGGGGGGGTPRPQPPEPPAPPPVTAADVLRITAVPANFAPSAETCKIDYALTRNSARLGKKVRITIKDRAGVTVYSGAGHDLDGGDRGSFAWDGKGSGGAFVGPLKSPFAVEAAMADDNNVMDKKEVKVELKEVSVTVVAPDNKLLMNDLNAKFEVVALVKIKKTDGSGVATRAPVDVTFTDPPENNTPFRDSFKHAEPDKYLGKTGDPDAVYFEAHASSAASSPDAYKQSIKATTIVAAGAEQGKAKIYFKPSGVGGDGYKLKAAVLDGGTELAAKESPIVTVWRFVAFDAIYEMQGETHVSTNGATAVISPVFDPAFVRYTAGAPISIDAAKSVKYIGLWTSVATPQQSWATVQAKT
ncbi:MAG: hypothetical protein H0T76_22905, partial [Nannocystis sp.]|nr:hypothetical protein [Nannocystis sp.]